MEVSSVIARLREFHAQGKPLNIHAAKRRYPDLIETVFSVRPFWGWRKALEDAGIDYGEIEVELLETVECRICGFAGKQLSMHLRAKHGLTPARYRERFPGADIKSERQNAMLRKAKGHLLPHWEPLYSEEYMMDRIAAYRRMGKPITMPWIHEHDHNLWQHVHRMGLEWVEFVSRMGEDYARAAAPVHVAPLPPREEMLEVIRSRATRGHAPTFVRIKAELPEMERFIIRAFGNYSKAVKAAGLKKGPPKKRPAKKRSRRKARKGRRTRPKTPALRGYPRMSREETVAALEKRSNNGGPMSRGSITREDPVLYYSVLRHFKTFSGAWRELGIEPAIRLTKAVLKYPDGDSITAEIRRRAEAGLSVGSRDVRSGPAIDIPLHRRAVRIFGTWVKAVEAAGLDPPKRWRYEPVYNSPDTVIQAIRDRAEAGKKITRRAVHNGPDRNRVLLRDAVRMFGGWGAAAKAAGFDLSGRLSSAYATPEAVIEAIRERAKNEKPLRECDFVLKNHPDADRTLYRDATRQFGSWGRAVRAAGLRPAAIQKRKPKKKPAAPPKPPPPTDEEIFAYFRKRLESGLNLASSRMTLYPDSNRIYAAALKRFGKWHDALRAAGYDPKEVTRPVRKKTGAGSG